MHAEHSGELMLLTGFCGGGKTTLARAAIKAIRGLEYPKTATTRPRRPEEIRHGSVEYKFVGCMQYRMLAHAAREAWDGAVFDGHAYGADVGAINRKRAEGTHILVCTIPTVGAIQQACELYGTEPVVIWVDTSLEVANERLKKSDDPKRRARINDLLQTEVAAAPVREIASVLFRPTYNLVVDEANFVAMIRQAIQGDVPACWPPAA